MQIEVLTVIIAYMLAVLIIGLYAAKYVKSVKDYLIYGHRMGIIPLTFTYFATYLSAVSVFGFTGLVYRSGWSGLWLPIIWATGSIMGMFIALRLRRVKLTSPHEYFRVRFGLPSSFQIFAGLLTVVALLVSLIVQIRAMGITWSLALNRSIEEGILISMVIVLIYTVVGGLYAVAYTDIFQGALFTAVLIGGGIWALSVMGGLENLYAMAAKITTPPTVGASPTPEGLLVSAMGAYTFVGLIFLWLNWAPGVAAHIRYTQRQLAAKNIDYSLKMYVIAWPILFLIYVCMGLTALAGRVLIPTMPAGMSVDHIMPLLFLKYMPPIITGLLYGGLLAAAMSTVDSEVQICNSIIFVDAQKYLKLSEKAMLNIARILGVIIVVIATLITLYPLPIIIEFSAYSWGILGSLYFAPMLIGLYWRRVNKWGVLAGVFGGLIVFATWQLLWGTRIYGIPPFGVGVLVSIVLTIVVSAVTKPPPEEYLKDYFPPPITVKAEKAEKA
ncbi:MAG: sodium:solute symporter family protein [Nitrososphaerota archaeon]|nr:sodium:solute symporter family protein [Nitrososphaerales archaeon]MDW8044610.1 sodium:solute symporter family protein [Nitrososphaerota archaeon]